MFKKGFGTCLNCGQNRALVVKPGLCSYCNEKKKGPAKKAARERRAILGKPNTVPMSQKKRKVTGELELFQAIWKERKHVSEISGERLGRFSVSYFMHVLGKGAYPSFRLLKENIVLGTLDEHICWDARSKKKLMRDPLWYNMFEKEAGLKREYFQKRIGKNRL